MTSKRTLIRGGQVYNHDGDVHKPAVTDILIEDDKIVSVGANLTSDAVHEVIAGRVATRVQRIVPDLATVRVSA